MNGTDALVFSRPSFLTAEISAVQDQVSSDLNDEMVILHVRTGNYYGLNDVGARVWNLIQGKTTPATIRDTILREYDIDQHQLESDLQSLLSDLLKKGLIEIGHAAAT